MPARPYWKGQIRLALVSIPVEVYSATRSGSATSFRQIHEPSGKPIHYLKAVTGIGPVDPEEIIRGYEYERGQYVLLGDDELEAVRLESRKTLELALFVDADAIDATWFEKPYYVVPADDLAVEAFVVLRAGHNANEAMAEALQEYVKKHIAPYKYPREVEFVTALPRTETGKLQRFKLRQTP